MCVRSVCATFFFLFTLSSKWWNSKIWSVHTTDEWRGITSEPNIVKNTIKQQKCLFYTYTHTKWQTEHRRKSKNEKKKSEAERDGRPAFLDLVDFNFNFVFYISYMVYTSWSTDAYIFLHGLRIDVNNKNERLNEEWQR